MRGCLWAGDNACRGNAAAARHRRRSACAPHRRCPFPAPAAVVAAAAAQPEEQSGGMGRTVTLALLFGAWYLFNIQFNM